ncbi:hypothetical protein [Methylobacterium nodulans]|uniref:Uncharacterized protein n=1 Tax=Methylobacterium nodulans (strain LMG 21967 / CNCM I-2342 / ORS 2060) TaxID=460265 RepID=B8IEQ9_METNO|nr:hypothetical protein [Methylobacterium nodulans]ACL61402.1 hypothetical protein Mnod_6635 [Methylobacterium nodulans ORS 2060]
MPNPDAWHPTRWAIVAGGVGLFVPAAAATELPLLRGDRKQFVQFEPQPAMRPLPLQDLQGRLPLAYLNARRCSCTSGRPGARPAPSSCRGWPGIRQGSQAWESVSPP